jgi:hypothetical protein
MTPANEFGDLKINHKFHKKGLDTKISQLNDQKIDPLSLDQGVWFEINRTTLDGNDAVEVVQEPFVMEGRTFYRPKEAPLDEKLADQALEACPDLNEIGFVLSFEQIQALVDSSGEPEDVDKIFGMSQKADAPKALVSPTLVAKFVPTPTPVAPVSVAPIATQAVSTPLPNDTAVQQRLAQIKAKKEAEVKAKAEAAALLAAQSKAQSPVSALEDPTASMTDEEFLAFAATQANS